MILVVCLRSWEEMANNPQYKKIGFQYCLYITLLNNVKPFGQ